MTRNAALDGLRGIAILLVVVFHHGLLGVGWVGVQLFFVLSGYLITKNLVHDKGLPTAAFFGRFYRRRTLRIFPVYFAYLALLAIGYARYGTPAELRTYWPNLVSYTYNLTHLRPDWTASLWFGHFWSLCVEEQFYLFWPAMVFALSARRLKKVVLGILVAGPAFRLAAMACLAKRFSSELMLGDAIYWLTPSQLDAFAAGAAVSLFSWERVKNPGKWALAASTFALSLGLVRLWATAMSGRPLDWNAWTSLGYPLARLDFGAAAWTYTVLNGTFALLVLATVRRDRGVTFLGNGALASIGRVSYAAYVVHRAVMILTPPLLMRFGLLVGPTVPERCLLLLFTLPLTLLVCAASYRWFERPLLALRGQ
jgi:peptidoglycan/LPS O-acetylase OafA/YrhL